MSYDIDKGRNLALILIGSTMPRRQALRIIISAIAAFEFASAQEPAEEGDPDAEDGQDQTPSPPERITPGGIDRQADVGSESSKTDNSDFLDPIFGESYSSSTDFTTGDTIDNQMFDGVSTLEKLNSKNTEKIVKDFKETWTQPIDYLLSYKTIELSLDAGAFTVIGVGLGGSADARVDLSRGILEASLCLKTGFGYPAAAEVSASLNVSTGGERMKQYIDIGFATPAGGINVEFDARKALFDSLGDPSPSLGYSTGIGFGVTLVEEHCATMDVGATYERLKNSFIETGARVYGEAERYLRSGGAYY